MNSWPYFSTQCRKDVDRVLRSGRLTAYKANPQVGVGPQKWSEVYALEREIERKFKVKHAVAVNSGTAGLHASLEALGVRGREVLTSPFTFSATAAAILHAGGIPKFCDVDPHTFCLDPKEVKRAITRRTAAILPVHLFGYFAEMSGLRSFGLPIVEDACQAVGSVREGNYAGTQGVAGVYSFNGSKNCPAGEGGALVTNSDKIAEKARLFVNHACNFGADYVGVNYRMHELVAVLTRHGLRELEERNQRRRELVHALIKGLLPACNGGIHGWKKLMLGGRGPVLDSHNAFYVYAFTTKGINRSRFISRCAKRGLQVGAGYITPTLDKYPAFRKYVTHDLPVAHELSEKTLCILSNLTPDKPLSEGRRTAKIIRESLE